MSSSPSANSKRKRNDAKANKVSASQVDLVISNDASPSSSSSKKSRTTVKAVVPTDKPDEPPAIAIQPDKSLDPWAVPVSPFFKVNPPPRDRPVRIYCDGIFDLFHFGHAKALEQAKKSFPNVFLLVGVCNDELTHRKKGKTVLTDQERYESLRHCKWVDEVVEDAPWVVDTEFLDRHHIDYVAHDDIPYVAEGMNDVYAFVKERGQFLPTKRTEGISTSDLITRIVRDYDAYLRRNLERGVSAKELNIGFLKSQELQVKRRVDNLRKDWKGTREEFKHELGELKNELRQMFTSWEDRSADLVRGFSQLFGSEGVVGKILRIRSASTPVSEDEESASDGEDGTASGSGGSHKKRRTARSPIRSPDLQPPGARSPLSGLFSWGNKDDEES